MSAIESSNVISTILKHDSKVTSYKIALLRAINDVVLAFPDMRHYGKPVAIPLHMLANSWIAYYWPFVSDEVPILQGPRAELNGMLRNDMAFRPALTALRREWEKEIQGSSRPSDGFFLVNELRIVRRRKLYPPSLLRAYDAALKKISHTIRMPIRYAGPSGEQWTVFTKPRRLRELGDVVAIPGTRAQVSCLVVRPELWRVFQSVSLWVEALCIHEWSLFTERVEQMEAVDIDRGVTYRLLTARPDNRRPLTWERNQVDILILEGNDFICPWTEKRIRQPNTYDMDHIVPVSVYPVNELWNLVPSDPHFNSQTKRDRFPTTERLQKAEPHLELAYERYSQSEALAKALQQDVARRFTLPSPKSPTFSAEVAASVVNLVNSVAELRNMERF